jgi:hypothetical protein
MGRKFFVPHSAFISLDYVYYGLLFCDIFFKEIFILQYEYMCTVHAAFHILLTSNNSTNHACIFATELL